MSANPQSPNFQIRVSDPMDQPSSSIWEDWGDLLDFNLLDSDPFLFPASPPPPPLPPSVEAEPPAISKKVRKRDPRLVCENYLAGRVPCACPELDAMMLAQEEEEEKRKKARFRVGEEKDVVRCQVVGCEVDIRELKGYHRRHRVCLRCANAERVVMDGDEKRYCQQCGKFHILPDFDEGKRSCRRKLERHNRRRRRKSINTVNLAEEKGPQADPSIESTYDGEQNEENGFTRETAVSSKNNDGDILLESDERASPVSTSPNSQNLQSNSNISFAVPGEAHIDEEKDNSKPALSSTACDNRGTYSSLCPTGRISFKLYDWNPAEFPRRLRHQIFQWLASMPVELEGYVRPGCTILTIFIAMPQFMWDKLSQDATLYIKDLVNAPDSLLLRRGNIFIFLSNMIIQVLKDGSSLMNVKMEVKAPRIHYVYPTYFEAGKPIEFVVCGGNLNQPKFRILVSFAGKYMINDFCAISHGKIMTSGGNTENTCHDFDHEMFRIRINQTDSEVLGPAFVEVENECGISNFIPILIGNKHICLELERLHMALSGSFTDRSTNEITISNANPSFCELLARKQTTLSELLVDIAWLLKEPCVEDNEAKFNAMNLQRLTSLLKISIQDELVNVMEMVLKYLNNIFGIEGIQCSKSVIPGVDLKQLQGYVHCAENILNKKGLRDMTPEVDTISLRQREVVPKINAISAKYQFQSEESRSENCLCSSAASCSMECDENTLLMGPTNMDRKHSYCQLHVNWPREYWGRKISSTRLTLSVVVSVVMCLGVCMVLVHPVKPGDIAVSIRRCLFGDQLP